MKKSGETVYKKLQTKVLRLDANPPLGFSCSRRFFIFSYVVFLSGCGAFGPKDTSQCMRLATGEEQMDCLYGKMFPTEEVIKGALLGFVAGAVLGGAIGFAMGNPFLGAVTGGIAGGIAGGVIAYYEYSLKRAAYNPIRALSDVHQDCSADTAKCKRFADASGKGFDDRMALLDKPSSSSSTQQAQLMQQILKDQNLRKASIKNMHDMREVYTKISAKIASQAGYVGGKEYYQSGIMLDMSNKIDELSKHIDEIKQDFDDMQEALSKKI